MYMFLFHSAYALYLLAIAGGVCLYVWAERTEGKGKGFAKFFGQLIIVLSIAGVLCNTYYGVKYFLAGYASTPMPMSHMMMQNNSTMPNQ